MNYLISSLYLRRLVNNQNIMDIIRSINFNKSDDVYSLSSHIKTSLGDIYILNNNNEFIISTSSYILDLVENKDYKLLSRYIECPIFVYKNGIQKYTNIESYIRSNENVLVYPS